MILVWDNIKSFQKHLEDMRLFCNSHVHKTPIVDLRMLKDMPIVVDIKPPQETGLIRSVFNARGKLVIVPIWRVNLSRGSQN